MKIARPIICAAVCLILGFLSGLSTFDSINDWYSTLEKPFFNPPNWIFGPVWSLLYLMMGIAVGLIWNQGLDKPGVKVAIIVFVAQFILNLIWTPVFFGMHQILWALVIIVALWLAIIFCMRKFFKLRSISGWLLVPYLLWVSFATILNAALWNLNG